MHDMNSERLLGLMRDYIHNCRLVNESLHRHVGLIGITAPLERSSYASRQLLEVQREKLRVIQARLTAAMETVSSTNIQPQQFEPQPMQISQQ